MGRLIKGVFLYIWNRFIKQPEEKKPTLKIAVDVDYRDSDASVAAVVFRDWKDAQPIFTETTTISPIQPYEPGAFYKRELPCILKILTKVSQKTTEKIELVVVDGYVNLEEGHPGLGFKLHEALDKKIPVVGVAKTSYKNANAVQVLRGVSKNPLYITAVGIPITDATTGVITMHGDYRIPTLLKLVDSTCRGNTNEVSS